MNNLFQDETKIKVFAQVQKNLHLLGDNADDYELDNLINQIPENFLNQKEDLMMICQIIAYYARSSHTSMKKNAIKIIERLMNSMKKYLQNESSFFWSIFGGLYCFQLWMFNEDLISFDTIFLSAQADSTSSIYEYFLPEIIENAPDYFEKEIKFHITCQYSNESIEKYKELRKKHFKWLRNSGDYHDPIYQEIESNRLRLAVKMDDIDTFQKVLSNSCMSINSLVHESVLENFFLVSSEQPLISYAMEFNSTKIIKFLLMNNVEINPKMTFDAIQTNDYEIIHYFESKLNIEFGKMAMCSAISLWNPEIVEYSLDNYNYEFLLQSETENCKNAFEGNKNEDDNKKEDDNQNGDLNKIKDEDINDEIGNGVNEKDSVLIDIAYQTIFSVNFVFLESFLLPFFKNNPQFVADNINLIVRKSFTDHSGFFLSEFMKYPGLDVNHHFKDDSSFLKIAIENRNSRCVEILLNNPDIQINEPAFMSYSALIIACNLFSDLKIIELLCSHSKMNVNWCENRYGLSAFEMAVANGNYYAVKYMIDHCNNLHINNFCTLFYLSLAKQNLFLLETIVKFYIKVTEKVDVKKVIKKIDKDFGGRDEYDEHFLVVLEMIFNDLLNKKL
ncbi:hypothetical protein M9Y10_026613 [Tritrichomonas musculus]|uniref:DUF3447 domain-containing protein n=1 Tax=Tritrichomonas musculus TaxID=1915356 RepID=A0ABR2H639_9EUKA